LFWQTNVLMTFFKQSYCEAAIVQKRLKTIVLYNRLQSTREAHKPVRPVYIKMWEHFQLRTSAPEPLLVADADDNHVFNEGLQIALSVHEVS